MAKSALLLGLTGGIGSGKSTVSAILATVGASIVDADAISRSITAAGGVAIEALQAEFGSDLLSPEKALDREKMRALVYSDPSAKARLERILHPLIGQIMAQQALNATAAGSPCIVFDIPLLVESGHWRQKLNRVLVVDCTQHTQIARVMARSGLDKTGAEKIVAHQATRTNRLAAADIVLYNDGINLDQLTVLVRKMSHNFGL